MSLATSMRKVTDDIRNSRQNLREAEKSRLNREDERQEEGDEQRKGREKDVNELIAQENHRFKEAKQLIRERVKEVKSFLTEVRDDLEESGTIFRSLQKLSSPSTNGKATKHSKPKKKKRK